MIISLLGYMGSGKTHISKKLAQKTGYKFIDLDDEIILKNGKSIPEIFEERGEIYFRKEEKNVLEQILSYSTDTILSLGGGTPAYFNNMDTINEKSESVFLITSVSTLAARLKKEKEFRPVIKKIPDQDLAEYIAKHLFERNNFYSQAKFKILTESKSADEIVDEIQKLFIV